MADAEEQEPTPAKLDVLKKYKAAGGIVKTVFAEIIQKVKAGGSVHEICGYGNNRILEETGKIYKKEKSIKKGIAFPTCLSVNNCICHFSPLKTDPDVTLQDGDMVKVDLGAQIDGYIAVAAHTIVVGASPENKVKGRKADVVLAAYNAAQVALRLVKPGNENSVVTEAIQKVADSFDCKPIEGMLSHQLRRNVIDGEKAFIINPSDLQRKELEKCTFEVHEVYGIDVLVSSGKGKGRDMDTRTTVYKKRESSYQLKMRTSRQFLLEVNKKFGYLPFSLSLCEDEKTARMGVVECYKHDVMQPFNVLYEKEGQLVAQFKFTVILMPNGTVQLTELPFDISLYESEHSIQDEETKVFNNIQSI
ncbi:hypothetical protein LOTGIDRAFT_115903 [Lottia gigantea]|uniref:Peptidase M24 domain-containing protein n=1 Tax=Lottia gigantea TaxID=225164 RepID=V3ZY85_LOTGI|nr:hypothetical protein LOTGIDRAFT_115903 [Lottia gigantea]ESO96493.1 hypothetical protein LOTGIDRAFT_115903 [Lottia gigantea]